MFPPVQFFYRRGGPGVWFSQKDTDSQASWFVCWLHHVVLYCFAVNFAARRHTSKINVWCRQAKCLVNLDSQIPLALMCWSQHHNRLTSKKFTGELLSSICPMWGCTVLELWRARATAILYLQAYEDGL